MKYLLMALAFAASPALADPVAGTWKTQPGDDGAYGHVKVAPCGSKICGTLVKGFEASGAPSSAGLEGTKIIWDMAAEGGGAYGGGKIYAPDKDKTYKSKMALSGNKLTVSGCVGPICRKQVWTRVN